MPIRDANLDVSPTATDLPLIATNRMSTTVDLGSQTGIQGLCVRLNYAFAHGSTIATGFQVQIHEASSTPVTSSDGTVGGNPLPIVCQSVTAGAVATGEVILPFNTTKRYVACEYQLTTAVASDSPSWSVVEAFITLNVQKSWDRNINFA